MIAFLPQYFFLLCLALTSSQPQLQAADIDDGGFSVELIHRDSPKSPFYNPSAQAPITLDILDGDYDIKFYLGTPPREIYAIFDTGSSITWAQCLPCPACYKQHGPYFDYSTSSTFQRVRCNTPECDTIPGSTCNTANNLCQYSIKYADKKTHSYGNVSVETIKLNATTGQSISIDNFVWGCGQDNKGVFSEDQMGIFGLGGSSASLLKQKSTQLGGQKFSYCLALDLRSTSTLNFGNAAVVSGPGVISTPLILQDSFYRVTLKAISVGNERFEVKRPFTTQGNAFVDTGTTNIYVPDEELYNAVKSAMQKAIPLKPNRGSMLCYYLRGAVLNPPMVTLHFDKADLQLNKFNTFLYSPRTEATCFTYQLDTNIKKIRIGNVAQKNFLVGIDLDKKSLSFKRTDCSKSNN